MGISDLETIVGAAIGAAVVQVVTGLWLHAHVKSLWAWAHGASKELGIQPPEKPATKPGEIQP
jgi:hypothetical protein